MSPFIWHQLMLREIWLNLTENSITLEVVTLQDMQCKFVWLLFSMENFALLLHQGVVLQQQFFIHSKLEIILLHAMMYMVERRDIWEYMPKTNLELKLTSWIWQNYKISKMQLSHKQSYSGLKLQLIPQWRWSISRKLLKSLKSIT